MAKHRIEQTSRGAKIARSALVTGTLVVGGVALSAGPAAADPIKIPGGGTVNIPGVSEKQIPKQFKSQVAKLRNVPQAGAAKLPGISVGPNARAADNAKSKIGAPYVWGAAGPSAFDCSGLVYWAYKQVGKSLPRTSYGMLGGGTPVSRGMLLPGDVIIYNGGGHAGIYVGNGQVVHSSTEGVPVSQVPLDSAGGFTAARRY